MPHALLQHHQVAHVVRHLMGQYRHGRGHAQLHIGQKGSGHQQAVAKGMDAVAHQHRPRTGHPRRGRILGVVMVMALRVPMAVGVPMLMAVVPQFGLVEQKEKHQTHQQGDEQLVGRSPRFKGFGQQMHEGRGQQSACRQTEQMLGIGRQQGTGAQSGHQHTAHACGQGAQNYIYEVHSAVLVGAAAAGAASKQGATSPHGHSFKRRRFV